MISSKWLMMLSRWMVAVAAALVLPIMFGNPAWAATEVAGLSAVAQHPVILADASGVGGMSAVNKATTDNPNSVQILKTFDQEHQDTADANSTIPLKQKHRILFYLGGALLLLVLTTGALGIAVGIFDRPWFMWHMISAGLTMTLAVVHAIVAMVWFFPF